MNYANYEYLNLNSLRKYPLRDGVAPTDTLGVFQLPDNFIVDLTLSASSDPTLRFYFSSITWNTLTVVLSVSDSNSNPVGSFTIPISGFTTNSTYYLTTVPGLYFYSTGRITIGYLTQVQQQPVGTFNFTLTTAEISPRAIIICPVAVNTITFTDNNGNTDSLSGNVNLTVRDNLRFSFDSINNQILLDAGNGLGLNTQCVVPTCIQTVNGVAPDPSTGNLSFIGIGCSAITTAGANTIEINDQCCTPCAGCEDLSTLTQGLNQLELSFQNARNFAQNLSLQITNFTTIANSQCSCT